MTSRTPAGTAVSDAAERSSELASQVEDALESDFTPGGAEAQCEAIQADAFQCSVRTFDSRAELTTYPFAYVESGSVSFVGVGDPPFLDCAGPDLQKCIELAQGVDESFPLGG